MDKKPIVFILFLEFRSERQPHLYKETFREHNTKLIIKGTKNS